MENRNYQLCKEADRILAEAGLGIFGRPKSNDKYVQSRFEDKMQKGAYCSRSERRK